MRKLFTFLTSVACLLAFLTFVPAAPGQNPDPAAKLQALSQQLKLTPQQKVQVLPILKAEGPKLEAIKEQSFASPDAEDEATPCHPRRKRAAVAENS